MSNLNINIEKAKRLIKDNRIGISRRHGKFERIYPFTNENLFECFNQFLLRNKDCLTVLASSDQALDLFLRGAKSVDTFDINPLTPYYFDLKKAFLMSDFNRDDYLKFFSYYYRETRFNRDVYKEISKNLTGDSKVFWDSLYDSFTTEKLRDSNGLFSPDEQPPLVLKREILYLSDDHQYDLLKEKISDVNIRFINTNVVNLPMVLSRDKRYDFIYLSNIFQYTKNVFSKISLKERLYPDKYRLIRWGNLITDLSRNLNHDGNIMTGYIYDFLNIYGSDDNFRIFSQAFPQSEFLYYHFPKTRSLSSSSSSVDSGCIVYKKRR